MAQRGPRWEDWVRRLPSLARRLIDQWDLRLEAAPAAHGHCSLVLPVRTADGVAAMLKIAFPDQESEHEHLALRHWAGSGAVRMFAADPHSRALLLERLHARDLSTVPEAQACEIVAGLYRRLHVEPVPSLRSLSSFIEVQSTQLANLPRSAPIPHRLVEQATALGRELSTDDAVPERMLHTDLHYANVLAAGRQEANVPAAGRQEANVPAAEKQDWLAIDPKPLNGDPHYELAPMLWNRWDEIAADVRGGVLRRLWVIGDAAGLDEDRARAWVLVRMVHNAMWEIQEDRPDPMWITRCIAVAKAVGD